MAGLNQQKVAPRGKYFIQRVLAVSPMLVAEKWKSKNTRVELSSKKC